MSVYEFTCQIQWKYIQINASYKLELNFCLQNFALKAEEDNLASSMFMLQQYKHILTVVHMRDHVHTHLLQSIQSFVKNVSFYCFILVIMCLGGRHSSSISCDSEGFVCCACLFYSLPSDIMRHQTNVWNFLLFFFI